MVDKVGLERFEPEEDDAITPCTVTMESEISYHVVGSSGRKYAINQILQSGTEMVIIIFDTDDKNTDEFIKTDDDENADFCEMKSNSALKQLALIACEESDIPPNAKAIEIKCETRHDTYIEPVDLNLNRRESVAFHNSVVTITKMTANEKLDQEEYDEPDEPYDSDENVEAMEDTKVEASKTEQEILTSIPKHSPHYGEIIIKRETAAEPYNRVKRTRYPPAKFRENSEAHRPPEKSKKSECNFSKKGAFPCQFCAKILTTRVGLRLHETACQGLKPHECDICGQKFTQKGSLRTHYNSHVVGKPLSCSQCGKRFKHTRYLREHIRSKHENKFNFKCDACNLTFFKRRTYIDHMNIHEGRKPWVCTICGRSFTQQSTLNKHKLGHMNGPEYVCYACVPNQCFKRINSIRKHIRLVHPQYAVDQKVDGKPIFGVELRNIGNPDANEPSPTPDGHTHTSTLTADTIQAINKSIKSKRTAGSSLSKAEKKAARHSSDVQDIILVAQI